ncbi:cation:proton antiporter [Streptomyces canus]|uniref:cation:proton antiporter n=1 Tax=Streptomyces canus TaxID=58343 RepID=UPI0033A72B69
MSTHRQAFFGTGESRQSASSYLNYDDDSLTEDRWFRTGDLVPVPRRCGQPAVLGEIVAGILLGPTLFHGALSDAVFPSDVRPMLSTLGNLGVALFMFLVGLELDHRLLHGNKRAAVGVSVGSIVCSFGLGVLLAVWLWNDHAVGNRLGFVLFIGAVMSITAFPVLARLLTDRGIQHTRVGALAMASAAVGDVVAWLLLAAVLTFTGSQSSWQVLLVLPYAVIMIAVVRPLLGRFLATREPRGPGGGEREPGAATLGVLTVLLLEVRTLKGAHWEVPGAHPSSDTLAARPQIRETDHPGARESIYNRSCILIYAAVCMRRPS